MCIGCVFSCAEDSTRLITASGDQTVRLWDVESGQEQHKFEYRQPCRCVTFSLGEKYAIVSLDPFMGSASSVDMLRIAEDPAEQTSEVVRTFSGHSGRVTRCVFGPCNKTILTVGEDGCIRQTDTETGALLKLVEAHERPIGDLKISKDGTCFITASQDKFAKLWDIDTLECLKEYNTERPVNACDISPLMDHVLVGGGQEASQVTLTGSRAGKFESKFYHKIFCDELGAVKGHFGPVNAVAYHPDGRSFASGGEDGYVRVHHMDADYFALK